MLNIAYVIDDSVEFNQLLKIYLKQLGIGLRAFTEPELFLKQLKVEKPDACFIDLNIGKPDVGFFIVQAIRNVLGSQIPVFVVSGRKDSGSITHAIEIGATDYITKPIDEELLATKLSPYVQTGEVSQAALQVITVPDGGIKASTKISLALASIEESGLTLCGDTLLAKGTYIKIRSDLFREIVLGNETIHVRVVSNRAEKGIDGSPDQFYCFCEFEQEDSLVIDNLRNWLKETIHAAR